ncbi:Copper-sensing transcriptional repressor CsoR [Alphaproteobacteria bacterium SO-S41]|nr:Copper-sensing transcriptional repressor CsoR [Alphaproteobacteria bacterium SO-S41]
MAHGDTKKNLSALKRIEGQVRGIAGMVEADRYCIDIVTQIAAARAALSRVEADLLRGHIGHCVHRAMKSGDTAEQAKVVEELVGAFNRR